MSWGVAYFDFLVYGLTPDIEESKGISYIEQLVSSSINHISTHSRISTEKVNTEFFYRTGKPHQRKRDPDEPMGMV